ncbi:MAG: hypothetical protein QMD22_01995 [archaeon]|nr:hypothetical protein [archaeon]
MEGIHRRISCICVVALLLLSLLGTGIVAAEEAEKGKAGANEAMNVPITVVYRGYGFALKGDGGDFHMLRMHIVRVREIDPMVIREIMEENKSIEEIKEEIIEKGGAPFYRGHMQFIEDHYRLVNVSVTQEQEGDNLNLNLTLTINADVMLPLQGSEPLQSESVGSVGNISVTVKDYEGMRIGKGKLAMYGEEYRVLLNLFL